MNPVLYIIYKTLKLITKTVFGIFFSKTTVLNKKVLKFDNPTILVSNHPNTLLDPLNVAARVDSIVFFLANAGLFEVPVLGPVLSKLYCIPIERQKDVNGRGVRNNKSFDRCDEFLTNGGCLYIAPEGTSVMEYRLRKLKTGTARIALRAESKNNFQLGLTIIPVGLTYSSPTDFRSEVLINAGEPIHIAKYQSLFEEDNFKAARKLTEDLQNALGNLIYNTDNDSEEYFIKKIETVLQNENPVAPEKKFYRTKKYIDSTRELRNDDLESYQQLNHQMSLYFTDVQRLKLNDGAIAQIHESQKSWNKILLLILGFPFFIYGYINNFLAFYIPGLTARKLNLYIGYTSTVKALTGLLTVPLFYGIQIWLNSPVITVIYAISLLPMGWFAWKYLKYAKQFYKNNLAARLYKKGDQKIMSLIETRKSLLKSLTSISSVVKI